MTKTTNPKLAALWKEAMRVQQKLRTAMRAAGGDIFIRINVLGNGLLCGEHLRYRGQRAPTNGCPDCLKVYHDRQRRINEAPSKARQT